MSAQPVLAPSTRPIQQERRRVLRLVPPPKARLARVPFLMVLIAVVGVGMVGLLLLNTGLQNQAFAASQLRQQAAQIAYQEGELTQLVVEAGSTRELTRRATELGMRPNRGIAFVELPDGHISGEPAPDDGMFLPSALTKSPEERARERADKALKRVHERRMKEQRVLLGQRQRILNARAQQAAAQQAAAQQAAAQQAAAQQGPAGADPAAGHAPAEQAGAGQTSAEEAPAQQLPADQPESSDPAGSR